MRPEIELAYLGVEVADVDGLVDILGDVVGLAADHPTADGVHLRNDEAVHRIVVTEGPRDDLVVLGIEAVDDEAFDAVAARLAVASYPVTELDDAAARRRGVDRLATGGTPWAASLELVVGLARTMPPALELVDGGFETSGLGMGHLALAVTDFADAERFLLEGLGMRQSDWIETEILDGIPLEVRFYHCNVRHHSVAVAKLPLDLGKALHHLQVECNERDDVGAAFDRAYDADLDFANGLGVHDNEGAFSFYVTTPAGFLVEVGTGTKKITEPWMGNRRYDRISRWGHQPLPPRSV